MLSSAGVGEPAPVSFGAEVRRRRRSRDLTLEQLAELSGLTPHYVSTVETGKRDPSLSTVVSLARGLGCAPGELLGGIEGLSPAALEAGRLFDQAPEGVRAGVEAILRAVVEGKAK